MQRHHPAAHLLGRLQGIAAGRLQDQAIAGLEGLARWQNQPTAGLDPFQAPYPGATFFAPAAMHQLLVIHPLEPARSQSPRETQLQAPAQLVRIQGLVACLRAAWGLGLQAVGRAGGLGWGAGGRQGIEPLAVGLGHRRHVAGVLEAPFDFEAGDARVGEVREQLPGGQVLGRQQVALLAEVALHPIDDQLIGKPAGLGALAPVGTALAEGLTGEALARIGHTQGPMHEHLQGHGTAPLVELLPQAAEVLEGQFPGQHHPLAAQFGRLGHPGRTGDRHLGGAVQGQTGGQLAGEPGQADVLDDQGVDASGGGLQHQLPGGLELAGEEQHVDGEEAAHAAPVQPLHHLGEVGGLEVFSPQPGVQHLHAEVHRIGAIGDGSPERLPATGRGEQFRRHGVGKRQRDGGRSPKGFRGEGGLRGSGGGPVQTVSRPRRSLQNASARARSSHPGGCPPERRG